MEFSLKIECDNAAFEGSNIFFEVARLLKLAGESIEGDCSFSTDLDEHLSEECEECSGNGQIDDDGDFIDCEECNGEGRI